MSRHLLFGLVVGLAVVPSALAQPRTHEAQPVTVVVPVARPDNKPPAADLLAERLKAFGELGDFKADAPKRRFTFALKLGAQLTWTALKAGFDGTSDLVLGDPMLVGRVAITFHESVMGGSNRPKAGATRARIRGLPGVTAFRDTGDGVAMVVAAPGFALSLVREGLLKSLTIPTDTDPIAEVTWSGPADPNAAEPERTKGGSQK